MNYLTSLAFHAGVAITAVLIGWSTEVRDIERRLIAAGCTAAFVNAVAFFPGQLIAGEFRDAFGWSLVTKTRFGALLGLATTVVWSGLRVRRSAGASATI